MVESPAVPVANRWRPTRLITSGEGKGVLKKNSKSSDNIYSTDHCTVGGVQSDRLNSRPASGLDTPVNDSPRLMPSQVQQHAIVWSSAHQKSNRRAIDALMHVMCHTAAVKLIK